MNSSTHRLSRPSMHLLIQSLAQGAGAASLQVCTTLLTISLRTPAAAVCESCFLRVPQHCVPARRCRRHRVVMTRRPPYGLRRCRLAKYFEAVSIRQLLESSPFINWVQVPECLVFYIHITRATLGSLSFRLPPGFARDLQTRKHIWFGDLFCS